MRKPTRLRRLYVSRISSKGQLTIPISLRQHFGIQPGTQLLVSLVDGGFAVARAPQTKKEQPT